MRKITGLIAGLGITALIGGGYALLSNRTPDGDDFSTKNARVWEDGFYTTTGLGENKGWKEDKPGNGFFNVDFEGMGDSYDATLFVDKQANGSYELSVDVVARFVPTEIRMKDGQPYRTETGSTWQTHLKGFEGSAPNREALIPAAQELLGQAGVYATGSQFGRDLDKLLAELSRAENAKLDRIGANGHIRMVYNRHESDRDFYSILSR